MPLIETLKALPESRLLISIAAGVTLGAMEKAAGHHRLIRVMPNTPALIGMGAAAYACGSTATAEDAATVERILGAVGTVTRVAEPLLDAVTGVSGSGPAYVYTFIEALADGGVAEGLTKDQALQLAAQTVAGAAAMVLQSGQHPAVLRDQVTSPGGTTIAALAALEARAFRSACIEAGSGNGIFHFIAPHAPTPASFGSCGVDLPSSPVQRPHSGAAPGLRAGRAAPDPETPARHPVHPSALPDALYSDISLAGLDAVRIEFRLAATRIPESDGGVSGSVFLRAAAPVPSGVAFPGVFGQKQPGGLQIPPHSSKIGHPVPASAGIARMASDRQ